MAAAAVKAWRRTRRAARRMPAAPYLWVYAVRLWVGMYRISVYTVRVMVLVCSCLSVTVEPGEAAWEFLNDLSLWEAVQSDVWECCLAVAWEQMGWSRSKD